MITILGFGNSLTAGFGLSPGSSFVDQLHRSLQDRSIEAKLINAGISGDTTGGGLARVKTYLNNPPDLVILELGANDGLLGLELQQIQNNLEAIIRKFLYSGSKILLCGIFLPPESGAQYAAKFNNIYSDLADKYKLKLYPDFLQGVAGEPALTLFDRFHPNEKGVSLIVKKITPAVIELIKDVHGKT